MTRSLKTLALALALTPLLPIDADAASAFRYDGLEIGYARTLVTGDAVGNYDLNSYSIEAMYSLTPSLVIGGSYVTSMASTTLSATNGATSALEINGAGPVAFGFLHHELIPDTDVLLGASYTTLETDIADDDRPNDTPAATTTRTEVLAGVRQQVFGLFELGALARLDIDAGNDAEALNYTVSARMRLDTSMDLAAYYSPDDRGDEIKISLKKYFGKPGR